MKNFDNFFEQLHAMTGIDPRKEEKDRANVMPTFRPGDVVKLPSHDNLMTVVEQCPNGDLAIAYFNADGEPRSVTVSPEVARVLRPVKKQTEKA